MICKLLTSSAVRTPRPLPSLCLLFLIASLLMAPTPGYGQIVLDQDFDSGSLNVPASNISYTDPNSPLVTLVLRNTLQRVHPRTYFRATGVLGLTPTFRTISQGQPAGHRHVFSYDAENWDFFDNGSIVGSWSAFGHNAPFAQDSVFIAHVLPYPARRTDELIASIKSSPWVSPTVSGDTNLVVGRTLGTAGGGYYDDAGRTVLAQNLYGFHIGDSSSAGPKTKVVIASGNHPVENTGTYTLEGLIQFLISSDPRAARLRRYADFYVYPLLNPEGRHAGYQRSNPEHPDMDHNRYWDRPWMITDLAIIEAAMKADTGGSTDYFFDFHSFGSATQIGQLWCDASSGMFGTPMAAALPTYEPVITLNDWTLPQASAGWAASPQGLNATYHYSPETGVVVGVLADEYLELGKKYGLALSEIIGPPLTQGDSSGDGYVDDDDLSLLLASWGLQTGRMNGNLNGDSVVDDDDLSLLLANWNQGVPPAPEMVPEPATIVLLAMGALTLIRRRRSPRGASHGEN